MTDEADDFAVAGQVALTEQVVERLVDAIVEGKLQPGERLVETKLAARMGVSRGPLREALKILSGQGLVHTTMGRGTRVAAISVADVENMSLLRAMLEGLAARQFVVNADAGRLHDLHAVLEDMEALSTGGDAARLRHLDSRFHEIVVEGANNRFLSGSWSSLRTLLHAYLARSDAYHGHPAEVAARHRAMVSALESGDAAEAEALFRSTILLKAYENMKRPVPPAMMGYITRQIRADGTVMKFGGAE